MNVTIVGQLDQVGQVIELEKITKREFIVKTVEERPNFFKLELINDKTSIIDGFTVGENIKVTAGLKGNSYTNKEGNTDVFMSLRSWKVEKL